MKTYTKYIITSFLKTFIYITGIFFSLVFIINLLTELDFFKDYNTNSFLIIYLNLLNSPSLIFEMFPFIFLISTQFFYIKHYRNEEIQILKYSGIKNTQILKILALTSFIISILVITIFYSSSSSLKNIYLEIKSKYANDGKYLAVITKNGLWIKDKIDSNSYLINANRIEKNFLIEAIISEFNENYELTKTIVSERIDIKEKKWIIYEPLILVDNAKIKKDFIMINSNFDYQKIQKLFSNLSSLSLLEMLELRENYKLLNISIVEIDVELQKLISYPFYLILMTVLSAIIMINSKKIKNTILKIGFGFSVSIIIFYINNFFIVLGKTEKIYFMFSVWTPIMILLLINFYNFRNLNDK